MRAYETITAAVQDLCPYCLSVAQAFGKHREKMEEYALEDRLRDGTSPMPERIKVIWEKYGKGWDWQDRGPVVNVPDLMFLTGPTSREPLAYEKTYSTFRFDRSATRNSWGTVYTVTCEGVTVEETYEFRK